MSRQHFDLLVVGSGAGLKIADTAAEMGMRVALVERGPFGGTCVNRGCIPSKMLLYPADCFRQLEKGSRLNISAKNLSLNYEQLVSRVNKSVDQLAQKIYRHYKKETLITTFNESGTFIGDRTILLSTCEITADQCYLGIGSRPKVPKIPGLKDTPFLTSDEALRSAKRPQSVAIVGAGFIAAELAHLYATAGSSVTILSRGKSFRHLDEDLRKRFLAEFSKSHEVLEHTTINHVLYENGIFTLTCNNTEKIQVESLLLATGRLSNADQIGIETTSVGLNEQGWIQVDEHLRTAEPNTWAFGDCIGGSLFRHMANHQARYLAEKLTGANEIPYQCPEVPYAIFTHPQVGVVGKTEKELQGENISTFIGEAFYEKSDMGRARRSTCGYVKLLFEKKTKKLLSAHILGDEAATMIHILMAFIQRNSTLEDLLRTVFIHPALPEVISSAAHNAKRKMRNE